MIRGMHAVLFVLLAGTSGKAIAQQGGLFGNGNTNKPRFTTPLPFKIFHLTNMTGEAQATEVVSAVRRVIDSDGASLIGAQNDVMVTGSVEQLQAAGDVIAQLDHPHPHPLEHTQPVYHLAYTITDTDGARKTVRHESLYLPVGQSTRLHAIRWLPLLPPPPVKQQDGTMLQGKAEHLEAGLTLDVILTEYAEGLRLSTKVQHTMLSAEQPPAGTDHPILEENELESVIGLKAGKPVLIGVIDQPNSARHVEIEVIADLQTL